MPELMDRMNEMAEIEIQNAAIDTLKIHPERLLKQAADAVDAVYVRSPEDDTQEAKKAAMVAYLSNLAAALEDDTNPLNFEFRTNEDGDRYLGRGLVKYKLTREVAAEYLVPSAVKERSLLNRVRKLAKKLSS